MRPREVLDGLGEHLLYDRNDRSKLRERWNQDGSP